MMSTSAHPADREELRQHVSPPTPPTAGAARAVFGRRPELARADAFLGRARERAAVMVLEGEPGIGKTTIWREVAARARERGFRVLAARPAEMERTLALSAVGDLLELVPAGAFAALPAPQRRALDVALLGAEPSAAPPDHRTLATAVRSLLVRVSADQPLLVAVDDVQWLDPTSATVLQFAMRRLTGRRVGWLLARRSSEAHGLALDGLLPAGAVIRPVLGPLDARTLQRLLAERLEAPLSRATLARISDASGGNPFHALEIARAIGSGAAVAPGTGLPVPDSLRDLLHDRVATLTAEAREALLAAAALAHPTAGLVERASSSEGLAAAEESGLLRLAGERVAFAHPLYASAVYSAAASTRRRQVHGRLAALVADPEERAWQLALAARGPDERVATMLEDGAALARARGAWQAAADMLERARALTPSVRPDDAARRGIAAGQHHVHAGDRARARALVEDLLGGSLPPALRGEALRLLAEISCHDENFGEALRRLTQALDHVDDARQRAPVELGLVYVASSLMDWQAARDHAYAALDAAERADDPALLAHALAHVAMGEFLTGNGVAWSMIDRALALEDRAMLLPLSQQPGTIAACLLLYAGRHDEARERMRSLSATARERGDESDLAFLLLWWSWLETRSGDLRAARALARESGSVATLTGSPSTRAWALVQEAYVLAHLGAEPETRRACEEALAPVEAYGSALPRIWTAAAVALLELSLGDARAALRACEPLLAALEADGIAEPVPAFFLPDALEAMIALGDLDRAEALLGRFEEAGRALDRAWALATGGRCRALLLAARGDLAAAGQALERALTQHARIDMPFERARTLLVRGVVERRMRRRAAAKASFEEVLGVFEALGARQWARRARAELERVGLRRAASGELTGSERRIAELAAQGLTNREVAAALFVSPKTVDASLARVYRKLGIGSRAELGARMAARSPPGS